MEWMLSRCVHRSLDGQGLPLPSEEDIIIPAEYAQQLVRLMKAPYSGLTNNEKKSDRVEADKYLPLIAAARKDERKKAVREFYESVWEKAKADRPVSGKDFPELYARLSNALYTTFNNILAEKEEKE